MEEYGIQTIILWQLSDVPPLDFSEYKSMSVSDISPWRFEAP